MKNLILAAGLILLTASAANAQNRCGNSATNRNHQSRIYQGTRSGQLTYGEMRRLENREAAIAHNRRIAKADGYISQRERARLQAMQQRTSAQIYREKHDGQRRGR